METRRYAAAVGLFILFLPFLNGCPLMMPFMMGPMLSGNMNKPEEFEPNEALIALVRKGVSVLSDSLGQYDRILLGDTTVTGKLISAGKFRGILLDELRLSTETLISDKEEQKAGGKQEPNSPLTRNQEQTVVLSARLNQANNRLVLVLELWNQHSNRLLWSGLFDKTFSNASAHKKNGIPVVR